MVENRQERGVLQVNHQQDDAQKGVNTSTRSVGKARVDGLHLLVVLPLANGSVASHRRGGVLERALDLGPLVDIFTVDGRKLHQPVVHAAAPCLLVRHERLRHALNDLVGSLVRSSAAPMVALSSCRWRREKAGAPSLA